MRDIRPIKTNADYDWAIAELDAYFDAPPAPESAEADRFDVLADLVSAYDANNWALDVLDPVDYLDGHMQNHGYSQGDLARVLGSASRASEIMRRKRPLTLAMIQRLVEHWAMPAEALVKPYPTMLNPAAE